MWDERPSGSSPGQLEQGRVATQDFNKPYLLGPPAHSASPSRSPPSRPKRPEKRRQKCGHLFVLAVGKAPGGELFHTGAQVGLRTHDIATALSRGTGLDGKTVALEVPDLAEALGFPAVAEYWASNSQSSGEKARRILGWKPQHLDLLSEVGQAAN